MSQKPRSRMGRLFACLALLASASFCGCGGGSSNASAVPQPSVEPVAVSISPFAANVAVNRTVTFTAAVTNVSNKAVKWSVQETNGGTVSDSGIYTAPDGAGSYHVVATSAGDTSKSATATVTVTAASKPVFTSTPALTGNVGDLYSYTIAANDPAGGTITFSLSGPTGAQLSGNQLAWTPSEAQGRMDNSFQVTATSSSGGSDSQIWTVTTNGIVRGKMNRIFVWSNDRATSPQDVTATIPVDLSTAQIIAVPASAADQSQILTGTGKVDGSFEIDNVPAGFYALAVGQDGSSLIQDFGGLWTDRNQLDLSRTIMGRPSPAVPGDGTTRHLELSGLNPWQIDDSVEFYIPNLLANWPSFGEYNVLYGLEAGATTLDQSGIYPVYMADESSGDVAIANQWENKSVQGVNMAYIARSTGGLRITDQSGQNTDVIAAMSDPTTIAPLVFRAKFNLSEFAALAAQVSPGAMIVGQQFGMAIHPMTMDHGIAGFLPYLAFDQNFGTSTAAPLSSAGNRLSRFAVQSSAQPMSVAATDLDLGDISVGNPFPPSWTPVYIYQQVYAIPVTTPGATVPAELDVAVAQETSVAPTSGDPIRPVLTPVTIATIDGKNLLQPQTNISLRPTFTWQPPSGGSANGYNLQLIKLSAAQGSNGAMETQYTQIASFVTAATTFIVPGLLDANSSYVLLIKALSEGGNDFSTTPNKIGFPRAESIVMSAVFTTGTASSPISSVEQAKPQVLGHRNPLSQFGKTVGKPAQSFPRSGLPRAGRQR